tara:strand:- start:374 stop:1189 length:816 start_codon:yes stop_codon:yes gene_type:complete
MTRRRISKSPDDRALSEILEEAGISLTHPVKQVDTLSTGNAQLDRCTGGIPRGRITQLFGDWDTEAAKMRICMQVLKNAQEKPDDLVMFVDADRGISMKDVPEDLRNPAAFLIVRPGSTEGLFSVVQAMVQAESVAAIVVHSIAALVPEVEASTPFVVDAPAGLHRATIANHLLALTRSLHKSRTAVVLTDQTRHKIYAHGDPTATTGGPAVANAASLRIHLEHRAEIYKAGPEPAEHWGARVRATVVKSKSSAPYRTCAFNVLRGRPSQK